jgi:hypothetical protein
MLATLLLRRNVNSGPLAICVGVAFWAVIIGSYIADKLAERKRRKRR